MSQPPERRYSLSYLTAHRCTPVEAVRIAASVGCAHVGLRPWPNGAGAAFQPLLEDVALKRETIAALNDSGVNVLDLEIVRIDADFDPMRWARLYELGAELGARSLLVAGDDREPDRLAASYARLCEAVAPYELSADLEFMPWTAVPDARAALQVVAQAGASPAAGILVDALHVGRSATTLDDIRSIPRRLLHHAQICDAEAGRGFTTEQLIHTARCERRLPGEGSIDLAGLFDALPPDLPVSVEVVNHRQELRFAPLEWAARCVAASRRCCDPHTD